MGARIGEGELPEVLGRGIDLVTTPGLRSLFRRRDVMTTCEVVYAA